ncbi:MAG: FliM/FliN family flagellar motor C-terminal domain-containing protein [Rhodocyclaceae bacterium]
MTEVRRFRLYAESELKALSAALRPAFERWARDWLRLQVEFDLVSYALGNQATPRDAASWITYGDVSADGLWMGGSSMEQKLLASALAGEAAKVEPVRLPLTPIVGELVDAARDALASALAGNETGRADGQPQPDVYQGAMAPGSGAVVCELTIAGGGRLASVLSAGRVEQLIGKPVSLRDLTPGLVSWSSALAMQKVSANALIGRCEISLADLATLAEGDTLVLDRKTDGDFTLMTGDGRAMLPITIGKKGAHVAAVVRKDS